MKTWEGIVDCREEVRKTGRTTRFGFLMTPDERVAAEQVAASEQRSQLTIRI